MPSEAAPKGDVRLLSAWTVDVLILIYGAVLFFIIGGESKVKFV